jgi:hypothetical protein
MDYETFNKTSKLTAKERVITELQKAPQSAVELCKSAEISYIYAVIILNKLFKEHKVQKKRMGKQVFYALNKK